MVSVDYGILPCQPHPNGDYGDHAYLSVHHPRNVHRRRIDRRGLAEIVGTVILVAIVVAAAAAFSLFVATYQSQLQNEEKATHDRNLEMVHFLNISVGAGGFPVYATFESGDVNYMNLTGYELNNFAVQSWGFYPRGGSVPSWMTDQACPNDTSIVTQEACQMIAPSQTVTAVLIPSYPVISSPIGLGLFTALANEFRFTFLAPVAIATVDIVQSGGGPSTPVFDSTGSYQPTEPDNASLVAYSWTIVASHAVLRQVAPSFSVGTAPSGEAFDPKTDELFVSNQNSGDISVVSGRSGSVVYVIGLPPGTTPEGLSYDSANGEICVADASHGLVLMINPTSDSIVKSVNVGLSPFGVVYDSSTNSIYVTNSGSGNVTVINGTTGVVSDNIAVLGTPLGIAFDSFKDQVFVADSTSGSVSVIDDSTNSVVATIAVGTTPFGVAFDSSLHRIYVTNNGSSNITAIDDGLDKTVANISLPTGSLPQGIAYDPAKGQMLVAGSGDQNVTELQDATESILASLSVGDNPSDVAYDPLSQHLFVTNSGSSNVSVLGFTYTSDAPEYELPHLTSGEVYTAYLNVTNSDGLSGEASVVYQQP